MTTPTTPTPAEQQAEGARFLRLTMSAAGKLLEDWVGPERAAEAKGRIASAFQASAMAARDPSDFYASTPTSVAHCVAIAALTGMMPGTGAAALAYLVPRRPRRSEPPQLNYQLSHRGLAALARRADLVLLALPCGVTDTLELADGEVSRFVPNIDEPPVTWDDFRGIVLVVKTTAGQVLFRGWVSKRLIQIRRDASDSFQFATKNEWAQRTDPWHKWPVEMAMKTAMHYAVSRGWAVIDDTEAVRALSLDSGDTIDVTPTGVGGGADAADRGPVKLEHVLNGNAPKDAPAEPATAEQVASVHLLVDQIDEIKDGEGMAALEKCVGQMGTDGLSGQQLEEAEAYLKATLAKWQAAVPRTSSSGAGKQGELV